MAIVTLMSIVMSYALISHHIKSIVMVTSVITSSLLIVMSYALISHHITYSCLVTPSSAMIITCITISAWPLLNCIKF